MGIAHGHHGIKVPKNLLHLLQTPSPVDQKTGNAVAQIMDVHAFNSCFGPQPIPSTRDRHKRPMRGLVDEQVPGHPNLDTAASNQRFMFDLGLCRFRKVLSGVIGKRIYINTALLLGCQCLRTPPSYLSQRPGSSSPQVATTSATPMKIIGCPWRCCERGSNRAQVT